MGDGPIVRRIGKVRANALTVARRQGFLDVLAATANAQRAAAAVEAAPSSFYRLRSRDAGFADAWQRAMDDALIRLEGEVLAHALGERGEVPAGDAAAAGEAGAIDVRVGLELLKRRDALAARGFSRTAVQQRTHLPIEEVERVLLARLDALARRRGGA